MRLAAVMVDMYARAFTLPLRVTARMHAYFSILMLMARH
jgi:hypothetical protein